MERLRKQWTKLRARVINGLLVAGLVLTTWLLLFPETLAELVGSFSILLRLLIVAILYVPVALPAYRRFQERRESQAGKSVSSEEPVARPVRAPMESHVVAEKPASPPEASTPSKAESTDLDLDNEDDFYTMLRSMSNEESKQNE